MSRVILIAMAAALLGGCMSLIHTTLEDHPNKIYIGTRVGVSAFTEDQCGNSSAMCRSVDAAFKPFLLIDLPFTFILDTVFLVYTVPASLVNSLSAPESP